SWTQTHGFFKFVHMSDFMLYVDEEPYLTLLPNDILELSRKECVDFPILTANQIYGRSKGNAISKGLFVVRLRTRAIYHLETTQFEVRTLASAVLTFLTDAVWWNKPLNI
ncbi:uncharacterized protein F5891DRAFT_958556, partial [Suillus fuscotomentosus]